MATPAAPHRGGSFESGSTPVAPQPLTPGAATRSRTAAEQVRRGGKREGERRALRVRSHRSGQCFSSLSRCPPCFYSFPLFYYPQFRCARGENDVSVAFKQREKETERWKRENSSAQSGLFWPAFCFLLPPLFRPLSTSTAETSLLLSSSLSLSLSTKTGGDEPRQALDGDGQPPHPFPHGDVPSPDPVEQRRSGEGQCRGGKQQGPLPVAAEAAPVGERRLFLCRRQRKVGCSRERLPRAAPGRKAAALDRPLLDGGCRRCRLLRPPHPAAVEKEAAEVGRRPHAPCGRGSPLGGGRGGSCPVGSGNSSGGISISISISSSPPSVRGSSGGGEAGCAVGARHPRGGPGLRSSRVRKRRRRGHALSAAEADGEDARGAAPQELVERPQRRQSRCCCSRSSSSGQRFLSPELRRDGGVQRRGGVRGAGRGREARQGGKREGGEGGGGCGEVASVAAKAWRRPEMILLFSSGKKRKRAPPENATKNPLF